MSTVANLRSIKQLAAERPAFTQNSLRWHVFNAPGNGLPIVRVGDRVLIDRDEFDAFILRGRQAPPEPPPAAARPATRKRRSK